MYMYVKGKGNVQEKVVALPQTTLHAIIDCHIPPPPQ